MTRAPLPSPSEFADAPQKSLALFGMSGVGKTHLARLLSEFGDWHHYSVDHRIGARYMAEHITDNLTRAAMASPVLRPQLMTGAIRIEPQLTPDNLTALSCYLGKPGDPLRGGLDFGEYARRQAQHREAEIMAMLDAPIFMRKARETYEKPHFLCDTSGSMVEVVDADDPHDPLLVELTRHMLFVYIRGTEDDEAELAARFDRDPKPLYFDEGYLTALWEEHRAETDTPAHQVDPDAFMRWSFTRLIRRRAPRYAAIADQWGITLDRRDVARVGDPADLVALICDTLAAAAAETAAPEPARRSTGDRR